METDQVKRIARRVAKARRRIAAGKREAEERDRIARLEKILRELEPGQWRS